MSRRRRAREAGASPQARWVCCSPIDGATTCFARDSQCSASACWSHGWSAASVRRHGTIERARWDGATLDTMSRRRRAREAGASPQARWVCCSPIDGATTCFARDSQCSASACWSHGWSAASVRRHGTIERARWDGATLDTMSRRRRAREAGASPQARWVCCSPIDGATTCFARDCQCSASACWSHGWSAASVRRHGTIERARWDGATLDTMSRRRRAREAGASPQARWVCCSPIDGATTCFARDSQCSASACWSHGWSAASVRRHGTIERARWDGATLDTMSRRRRAREAGASPQARWVCCSPIDGATTCFARDSQCSASACWSHGWSAASVRRHGTIERARWDGATLDTMSRRRRAREAGASPQARWVCCSPIDGATTCFARDSQCSASACWSHGWSAASVRRHGTIERARWDGATLDTMSRRRRAREAGASPQARWVCCSPIDGATTCFARDCQCSASACWSHGWSAASVRRHGTIERARWDGATLDTMSRRRRAREAGASPQARWVCCSPIDGATTCFARDSQCSASACWSHGWSAASVRRHGTIERARWDGATLDTMSRRRRAREAGASPQARWVCCSPIDGATTCFARDSQCSASACWSHGWSAASVRRHGTIERARWDGATLDTMSRRRRAREAGAGPQARWVCCSPIDGATTCFARDCQCSASACWSHGWSAASVRRHGTIERARWDGATLDTMSRRRRAREAGASPQARWVCCSPIDGATTCFARDSQCSASACWSHGWSAASVRRHGTIERARWDGATLDTMSRRRRAREAGAGPQARWVCCSPIDGATTCFARDSQCSASACWSHGWSAASVRRHGTIERARWDGATLDTMSRRRRAREAGAGPQARWVCCSPIDGATTCFARDSQCSASACWSHGWSAASVRRHGTIERARWDGATLDTMSRRRRAREAGASPQARWVCCSPIDGATTCFARDSQCSASACWSHGWSAASVRRHGTIERARWDGATLDTMSRRRRAREAGASPQARWVCCSPIDGATTCFARDSQCSASACWSHGWSAASVRRHGTIERARWDGATLDTMSRRRRAREAGASPQARWVCCSPIDGATTCFARDCQCSASACWSHGWSAASVRRHGTIERARWDGATLDTMSRRRRAREAGAGPQARWVCCSPIDGATTCFARDSQCSASACWSHGWSAASVRRHGTIERARWDGATLDTMSRRRRAREAGASPQARWVCCSPIDGATTCFARDSQCSASACWSHGWSAASVRRHGTIERARWDGATLDTMSRRRRAREAGASPQARWVCCSPIDGATTCFARDCQCSASACWSHGWSAASVRRHGTIERARWDGATLDTMSRRRRAREAGASPQARWVCCSPIDGATTCFARDCQCSASACWSHGWSAASVRRHGTIERARWDGATLDTMSRRRRAREAGASPQARWVCCSPIDGATTCFARDSQCSASACWSHGWSAASVRRHGTIERARWDGATLDTMSRRRRAREAGASPQARWVCCSPIDGATTCFARDSQCSASACWSHGWSAASVRRHGTIERARWDGATLDTMSRRRRAREAGASPQARWVCCSPIDGATTCFARDCQCSASACWSHGWSAASVRRHGTIERARWDGATLDTMSRRRRAREAGASPQARWVCCSPIDGATTCFARDCQCSASACWCSLSLGTRPSTGASAARAPRRAGDTRSIRYGRALHAREAAVPSAPGPCSHGPAFPLTARGGLRV